MPQITQQGVCDQATLCRTIVQEAVEAAALTDSLEALGDYRARADRYMTEISLWQEHSIRRNWVGVAAHCAEERKLAQRWFDIFGRHLERTLGDD